MKIVLFEPEIPQNTGNIVRTCSITGTDLVLVKPYGFQLSNRYLKRAGLDYWDEVQIEEIDCLKEYLESQDKPFYFYSSKANKLYTETQYTDDCLLIFGAESSGLPEYYHKRWSDQFRTLPMLKGKRSLNLANTASIVLYEALRQQCFAGLSV